MSGQSGDDTDRFAERKYFAGKHSYHGRKDCANHGVQSPEKISLIKLSRTELTPCGKCNPSEKPIEFAVCLDCGWQSPVEECQRDRGYKGACPACGSAKTTSEFRLEKQSLQTATDRPENSQ